MIRATGNAGVRPAQRSGDNGLGDAASAPPVAPGKSCGSCTACCKVLGIPELKKQPFEECRHIVAGVGCAIYSERPHSCRNFICGWLLDPNMGPELKPDQCHVVFYQINGQNIVASCDADYPDAWRHPHVTEFMRHLAGQVGPHRKVVLVEKGRTWLVSEQAIVPADTG